MLPSMQYLELPSRFWSAYGNQTEPLPANKAFNSRGIAKNLSEIVEFAETRKLPHSHSVM